MKLKEQDRTIKLLVYFKDGNTRTFWGSYKNQDKSLKRLEQLIINQFKGTYETALIYQIGQNEPVVKYVNDMKLT